MENINDRASHRIRAVLIFLSLALYATVQAETSDAQVKDYKLIELKTDTLPNLNIERCGHVTLCLDGEITVFGGHTKGFVPTATAEYLSDGKWHTVQLAYPHDHATIINLRSGHVFLAGGHKEPLGIGQLYSFELYDPDTHTSQGIGCMDKKRAYANAIEMTDGQVVIAGNWFADDGIEMFENIYDPLKTNALNVKETSFARATPYILRISDDDAIVFGSLDNKANPVDSGIVDRLNGPSYHEPFLDKWHPLQTIDIQRTTNHFIGDEDKGHYEWLVPVINDETRQVALARIVGPDHNGEYASFSLLSTQQPLPDTIQGKQILYTSLVCDRERHIAYLIGNDDEARIYVIAIPYENNGPAPLTIYTTQPQPIMAHSVTPVIMSNGDLVFAGGHLYNNFSPTNTVIRLRLGDSLDSKTADAAIVTADPEGNVGWLKIIIPCLLACIILAIIIVWRKKAKVYVSMANKTAETIDEQPLDKNLPKDEILTDLFKRIERLMENDQLYLNANLRASDVAALVGSNTAYVSAAINSQRGCSFTQFLTTYRIAYAQQLMREDPERKISAISTLAGFSTDSTFFRAFRTITGMSPKEWLTTSRKDDPHP